MCSWQHQILIAGRSLQHIGTGLLQDSLSGKQPETTKHSTTTLAPVFVQFGFVCLYNGVPLVSRNRKPCHEPLHERAPACWKQASTDEHKQAPKLFRTQCPCKMCFLHLHLDLTHRTLSSNLKVTSILMIRTWQTFRPSSRC